MSDISEKEVWLRAYCSALTGYLSNGQGSWTYATARAREVSDQAVKDFAERFPPPFQMTSDEKK
jgi:hypothetical protein